ncbi:MAG: 2-amino-4-hydroxy-6-hydroxymethyldihydropteridine diphosphokinase [Candidatus Krumholzibacteria bacterium]|jgi:2-amino-4-hydroxy-6-hydroxymethyldihydropteridine diphosphokinase|nr:2-amino-4-hydroxy-6-hydroxymethyldihydropteridine diphosphokinase [Candidatus Krumholzibacteria bacterium]MDP6669221.1 2-amino-4-hydroxy-6-hydroxymethyldihydropteridine diphosphokinase [Candidatus Krumholzibacteria bacterium]MDP6796464.1 2-amino-4-hydroxy-6-hydroxymethyldihydropteridine diphosphokinase [Candidatus Krumholzibacteria bacterium]MDP7021594.1 2-amino-4-hydroxy-6-hydroxymethyldihydropteridine diphosphokinase [Candidatus Krumholzibacteria bacterium]
MREAPRLVALSLGSNLGDRRSHLRRALRRLDEVLEDTRLSSLWETEAVEVDEKQNPYLNLCLSGSCRLTARELLEYCKGLEVEAGRRPGGHRLPRELDVDLLFLDQERHRDKTLSLPHPGLPGRRFVLAPLAEILPDWRHPELGLTVRELLSNVGEDQAVRRLETGKDGWDYHGE